VDGFAKKQMVQPAARPYASANYIPNVVEYVAIHTRRCASTEPRDAYTPLHKANGSNAAEHATGDSGLVRALFL